MNGQEDVDHRAEMQRPSLFVADGVPADWSSIFSSIRAQLPSLNSDTSMCGDEDDVSIFQRHQDTAVVCDEESEADLDISLEDPELEDLLESVRFVGRSDIRMHPWKANNEKEVSALCDPSNTCIYDCCVGQTPLAVAEEPKQYKETAGTNVSELADFAEDHLTREGCHSLSNKKATKIMERGCITCPTARQEAHGAPRLDFQALKQLDLDGILLSLQHYSKEDRDPGEKCSLPSELESGDAVPNASSRSQEIMDKLAQLCVQQSQQKCQVTTMSLQSSLQRGGHRSTPLSKNTGTVADLNRKMDHPTVYLDLRNAQPTGRSVSFKQPQEKIRFTETKKHSSLSSSAEEDEEEDKGPSQKATLNQDRGLLESADKARSGTCKSILLCQRRKTAAVSNLQVSRALESPSHSVEATDGTGGNALKVLRRRCRIRGEVNKANGVACIKNNISTTNSAITNQKKEKRVQDSLKENGRGGTPTEDFKPCMPKLSTLKHDAACCTVLAHSSDIEMEQVQLKQKEKNRNEQQRKHRLQDHLESLKPRHSVMGKQTMAEKTPVLFNAHTSYLPNISTLPAADNGSKEMLLMTMWLTSCGQAVSRGQHTGRLLDVALSASSIYNTIVTWLLSLVSESLPKQRTDCIPFHVVSLQQLWREDGLALYACVMPTEDYTKVNCRKSWRNKIKETRGTTTFYQQLSTFLSQTPLLSIAWWKEELNNCLQDQLYPLLVDLPTLSLSNILSVNPDAEAVRKAFDPWNGFYWQTVETSECFGFGLGDTEDILINQTEITMAVMFQTLFSNPLAFHHTLQLILCHGLDICGLRLLYPKYNILASSTDSLPALYRTDDGNCRPVLALALRGPKACSVWQDIVGPSDPQLAILTDQFSVNATYCKCRNEPLLYSPRLEERIHRELCVWFGGRVSDDGVIRIGVQNPTSVSTNKTRPQNCQQRKSNHTQSEQSPQETDLCRPPATLIATTKADVFLVVSSAVPCNTYGDVISVCSRQGFTMLGVKRMRLSVKRLINLGINNKQIPVYGSPPACSSALHTDIVGNDTATELPSCCLLLLLRKENASHHIPGLLRGLMNEFAEQGLLGPLRSRLPPGTELETGFCFHVAPYTESLLQGLGGNFSTVPDSGNITIDIFSAQIYTPNPEMEQVVVLSFSGRDSMEQAGNFLQQIIRPITKKSHHERGELDSGFELLSLKCLPYLTRTQALEVTPFEVGDKHWQESINQLVSRPALICALRRINAFAVLAQTLQLWVSNTCLLGSQHCNLERVMSLTSEMAFRQIAVFFTDRELISDHTSRPLMKYIPPMRRTHRREEIQRRGVSTESIFKFMLSDPQPLVTLLLIKPYAWPRSMSKILRKLDLEKFQLVGIKLLTLHQRNASAVITVDKDQQPELFQAHLTYLTSAPSVVLCIQRENAVKKLLDLLGPEDPQKAKSQNQFLWRAEYGTDHVYNAMYGSSSYQNAVNDVKLFFKEGLCCLRSEIMEEEEIASVTKDLLISNERQKTCKLVNAPLDVSFRAVTATGMPFHTALCQVTCLLLPFPLLSGSHHPPYIEVLEQLSEKQFELTGVRMTVMDQAQALCIAERFRTEVSLLSGKPCLILALQRDNAVTCFSSLLDSISWKTLDWTKYREYFLYPKDEEQAKQLLCVLFDYLTPNSALQISPQDF
ncbi:dynein axonemal assembly factor 8-like [Protopterus annectens]|uniref:dynein axonemal assembly factor 8-like n=1 Tax=Protopterus annectens TaxID=7888 RepID=UPI001CFB706A|nr:dynein axonemal assembly factor 8-like [Protopterus annectens]